MGKGKAGFSSVLLCCVVLATAFASGPGRSVATAACGDEWRRIGAPGNDRILQGVAVRSRNKVWAVGSVASDPFKSLVLRWDGDGWDRERAPNVSDQSMYLEGASVARRGPPIAVGEFSRTTMSTFAIRRKTAAPRWRRMQTVDPGPVTSGFDDVSLLSKRRAWAVGSFWDGSGDYKTVVERFTRDGWKVVTKATREGMLHGVDARAADDVWVVGRHVTPDGLRGLTMRFNGSDWRVKKAPQVGNTHNLLKGVAASSRSRAFAVGETYADKPVLLRWNGERWRRVDVNGRGVLEAVSVHDDEAVAVGHYTGSAGDQPFVLTSTGDGWSRTDMSRFGGAELVDVEHAPDGSIFAVSLGGDVLFRPPLCG